MSQIFDRIDGKSRRLVNSAKSLVHCPRSEERKPANADAKSCAPSALSIEMEFIGPRGAHPDGIGILARDSSESFGLRPQQIVAGSLEDHSEKGANSSKHLRIENRRGLRIGNRQKH